MLAVTSLVFVSGTAAIAANQIPTTPPVIGQAGAGDPAKATVLNAMIGKKVLGKSREYLGDIVSVDGQKNIAQMKAPTGAIVAIPAEKLTVEEDHLRASTLSRGDVLALIRESGQAGVFEVDSAPKPIK
jgi:hypothetical protein